MGAGASAGELAATIRKASDGELLELLEQLPLQDRERLEASLQVSENGSTHARACVGNGPQHGDCKQLADMQTPQAAIETCPGDHDGSPDSIFQVLETYMGKIKSQLIDFFTTFSTDIDVCAVGSPEAGDPEHLCLGMELFTIGAYLLHAGLVFRVQPESYSSIQRLTHRRSELWEGMLGAIVEALACTVPLAMPSHSQIGSPLLSQRLTLRGS
eukprot:TRINITY_DN24346_c0_g1_i2.p2 TRINITY_DN24346_c0_g1~~TRINITY_DN24346_c0_g1_i2.p2  ORF type:complete len:214 (-),score=20.78 TRINITY_DN24346_c0_g1_i2:770-1411(-)